jgi:hypothetical protein
MEQQIPRGLCQCGCGQKTSIAPQSSTRWGHIRGEFVSYATGHNGRAKPRATNPICACGCGRPLPTAEYRSNQATYLRGHQPHTESTINNLAKRFWARVEKADGCWMWKGPCRGNGHGTLQVRNRTAMAHRVAWQLTRGPIPEGLCVCHHCDNPPCVNPGHLFLGTHRDNMQDMIVRNRRRHAAGERNGRAKLTPAEVEAIRADSTSGDTVLGRKFGVCATTIHGIRTGRLWSSRRGMAA